ncbi:uncharacterized protein [Hetaerina americana]|uniref:uncharacterized protein isoform X2 n=2 Tax=Hetaerina americana TaxID=62018 RepID=UPI003A7F61CA
MEDDKRFTVCRLCLCPSELLINVYERHDGYTPADVISELLEFEVSTRDIYPQCVCEICMRKLKDFKVFKELCKVFKASIDRAYAARRVCPSESTPIVAELSPVPCGIEKILPTGGAVEYVSEEAKANNDEVIVPDDPMDIPLSVKNCSVKLLNISCVDDKQIITLDMNPHPEELHGDNAATEEIKEKFSCDDNGVCVKEEDDSSSEDYSTMDEEGDTCRADEENVENGKQIHKGEQLPVKTHVVLQGNSVDTLVLNQARRNVDAPPALKTTEIKEALSPEAQDSGGGAPRTRQRLTRSMAAAAGKQSKGKENKPLYCADPDDNSDSDNFLDDIEDDSSSNLSMDANSSDSNSDDEFLPPSAKKFKGKGMLDNFIRTSGTSKISKFLVKLDKKKCKGVIKKAEKPHLSSTLSTLPECVIEKELEDPASKEDKDSVNLKRSYEICQAAVMRCPEPSQLKDILIPPPPSLLGAQQSNDPVTLSKYVSPAGKSSSGSVLKRIITQLPGRSSVEDKSVNHMASTSEASGREDGSSGLLALKPQTSMGNEGEVKRSEVPPKNDDRSSSSSSDSEDSDLHSNDDLMEEEKEKGRLDNIIGASGTSGASNSPVEHGKRKCIVVIKRAEGKGTLDNFIGTSGTSVISNSCEDYRKGKGMLDNFIRTSGTSGTSNSPVEHGKRKCIVVIKKAEGKGMLDNFIRTSGTSGTSNSPVERDKRKCIVVIKKAEGKGTLDNFIRTSGTSRTSNSPVKPDIRKCTVVIKKAEKPHLSSTLSTLPESVSEKELEDPSSKEDKDSVDLKRSYEICQTASMKCPEPSQLEDKLIPPPPSLLGAQQSNDPVTLSKYVSPAGKSSSGSVMKRIITQLPGRSSVEDKSVNHMASTSEASGREGRSCGFLPFKPQTSMGNKVPAGKSSSGLGLKVELAQPPGRSSVEDKSVNDMASTSEASGREDGRSGFLSSKPQTSMGNKNKGKKSKVPPEKEEYSSSNSSDSESSEDSDLLSDDDLMKGEKVSTGDIYPQCVCEICMRKLKDFKVFKELCKVFKASIDRAYAARRVCPPESTPIVADLSPVPCSIEKILPIEVSEEAKADHGELIVPDDPMDFPMSMKNCTVKSLNISCVNDKQIISLNRNPHPGEVSEEIKTERGEVIVPDDPMDIPMSMKNCSVRLLNISCVNDRQIIALDMNPHPEELHGDNAATEEIKEKFSCDDNGVCIKEEDDSSSEDYSTMDEEGDTCGADEENVENEKQIHKGEQLPVKTHVVLQGNSVDTLVLNQARRNVDASPTSKTTEIKEALSPKARDSGGGAPRTRQRLTRSMAAAAGKQSKGKENKPLYCADPDDNSDSNNFLDDIEDDSSSNLSMDANSSDSNSDDESLLPSAKKFKGKGTLDNSIRTSGTSKRSKFLVILDKRKCKGVIIKAEGDSSDDPKKPHLSSTLSTLPESVSEKELEDPASKEDKDSVDLKRSYEICQTASMKCPEPSQLEDKLIPPPPSLLGAQQSNDPVTLPKCVSPAGKSSSGLGLKGEVTQPSGRSSVEDKSVNHMASTSEASGREDRSSGHLAPKPQTSMGNKGEVKRSEVPPKNDDPSSSSSSDSKESDLHSNDDLMEEEKGKGRLDNIIGKSGTPGASNSPVKPDKRKCIVVIKKAEGKGTLDNFIGTSGTSVISNSCEDYRKGKGMLDNFIRTSGTSGTSNSPVEHGKRKCIVVIKKAEGKGMLDNFIRTSGTSGTSNSPVERDKRKCIVVIKKAEGKGTLDNFIRTSGTSRTSNSPVKPDIRKCTVVIKRAEKPHLSSTLSTLPESVSEKELEDPSSKEDKDSVDLKRSYEICQTASMKCPEPSQLEDKLIPPPPSLLGAQQSNDPVTLSKYVSPAGKSSSGSVLKRIITRLPGRSSVEDKSVNHMASTSEASGREDRSSGFLAFKPQTSMGNKVPAGKSSSGLGLKVELAQPPGRSSVEDKSVNDMASTSEASGREDGRSGFLSSKPQTSMGNKNKGKKSKVPPEKEEYSSSNSSDSESSEDSDLLSDDDLMKGEKVNVRKKERYAEYETMMNTNGVKKYECPECGKKYQDVRKFREHIDAHKYGKRFKCETCGKLFSNKSNLKSHLDVHIQTRQSVCDVCGKTFKTNNHLVAHKRTHGERKIVCEVCGKKFITAGHLKRHQEISHNKEKTHPCEHCGKLFSNVIYLKKHIAYVNGKSHNGKIEKRHSCSECDHKSYSPVNLRIHYMSVHSGERPFKCSLCEKHFVSKRFLSNHVNTHTREKNYKCDLCEAVFTSMSSLERHKKSHSGRRDYKCDICGKDYTQSHNLKNHKKKHERASMK